jgi:hypothetical protein
VGCGMSWWWWCEGRELRMRPGGFSADQRRQDETKRNESQGCCEMRRRTALQARGCTRKRIVAQEWYFSRQVPNLSVVDCRVARG